MSRFERKILFAIGLSVFLTLGGSSFLAQGALREVYAVGVNERFGAELVHGVEARRPFHRSRIHGGSASVSPRPRWDRRALAWRSVVARTSRRARQRPQ